jgi:hypothetical protein
MSLTIENTKPYPNKGQVLFSLTPPLRTPNKKSPEDCWLSFIDQLSDGFYSSSKLVRNEPRKTADTYFTIKTRKTSVRSYRRNYSHKSIALFRNKNDGPTRGNIAYILGSFLEIDGSTDNTIKTRRDVLTLVETNNFPKPSYVIETSIGHFHIVWTYNRPLPFTEKNESYWISQQSRLIQLFGQAGFLVDKGASMNPVQNLRNPSQLKAYNFKRRCKVIIHKTYQKTSLRAIYRALNGTSIPNPKDIRASVKLRRFLRANRTFTTTYKELAEALGVSVRTAKTEVQRAIRSGDMFLGGKVGSNKGIKRATRYKSGLYIEPWFSEVQCSISKTILWGNERVLGYFLRCGAPVGCRNRTVFACGLYMKLKGGGDVCLDEAVRLLRVGGEKSGLSKNEVMRTLGNAMKSRYTFPLSVDKLRLWGLLE